MTDREKRVTAYHEGGHTVVAHFLEHHDPPHKVTIVSRGMAGGYTRFLPDEETHYRTPSMFRDQLCSALGGHAAEELVFGEASTGPSNDIEQVTRIARAMVTRWGMSERLGPRTFGKSEELVFLGREISRDPRTTARRSPKRSTTKSAASSKKRTSAPAASSTSTARSSISSSVCSWKSKRSKATRLHAAAQQRPERAMAASRYGAAEDPKSRPHASGEESPRRPAFEPKPATGLAWEAAARARLRRATAEPSGLAGHASFWTRTTCVDGCPSD